jgi:TatD DNase family protein
MLLLTCGVDRQTSEAGLVLARENRSVGAFVGLHPSEVLKEPDLGWIPTALAEAHGAGEIGLDPKYSTVGANSPQMRAFLQQLDEAARAGKPIQVHSRGAVPECLTALGGFTLKTVLFHWFQDEGRLNDVSDRGYYVSFGPSLLYSKKLQQMGAAYDRALVLTETDAPVPYKPLGGAMGPTLVPSVVFKLAELWRVPFEEARETIAKNAERYLGPSEKG